jgi:hypothetical protein
MKAKTRSKKANLDKAAEDAHADSTETSDPYLDAAYEAFHVISQRWGNTMVTTTDADARRRIAQAHINTALRVVQLASQQATFASLALAAHLELSAAKGQGLYDLAAEIGTYGIGLIEEAAHLQIGEPNPVDVKRAFALRNKLKSAFKQRVSSSLRATGLAHLLLVTVYYQVFEAADCGGSVLSSTTKAIATCVSARIREQCPHIDESSESFDATHAVICAIQKNPTVNPYPKLKALLLAYGADVPSTDGAFGKAVRRAKNEAKAQLKVGQ